jgi:ArsR family transcriptional regulator, lead/cadmium/zinc/bismuth-responsive transcriptional repressor
MKATAATLEAACQPKDHGRKKAPQPQVSFAALEQAERLFKALGDVPRLRLLAVLAQGEACVSELAELDHDGLSTVSQRLRVLHQANLVSRRREGKHILYGLADQHISDLIFNALAHASEGPARTKKRGK